MNKSLNRLLTALCMILILYMIAACKKDVNATVRCSDFGRIKSDFGILNLPNYMLGTVLVLNPATKRAEKLLVVPSKEENVIQPAHVHEKFEIIKAVNFALEFDVSIPLAVKANIENDINANTQFVLYNQKRLEVKNPLKELSISVDAINEVNNIDSTMFVIYIQALEVADSLDILLKRDSSASATTNLLRYGEYVVRVSYACKQYVSGFAQNGGAWFWKYTQVKYDKDQARFVLDSRPLDVYEYDFGAAITTIQ